jgi:hypothetical protein
MTCTFCSHNGYDTATDVTVTIGGVTHPVCPVHVLAVAETLNPRNGLGYPLTERTFAAAVYRVIEDTYGMVTT